MPALDRCHPQVVRALEKAGWVVTAAPVTIATPLNTLFADVGAQQYLLDGVQAIIVIEVKCFSSSDTTMHDLYVSIGQYLIYRSLLSQSEPTWSLYLAIPSHAYHDTFKEMAMMVITESKIKLIVVDLANEVIEQWLE